jgi:Holliday junction resolvase RusA-like endonuclease
MITLKLVGTPKSKKNQRAIRLKGGKIIMGTSNAYNKYRKECLSQIVLQKRKYKGLLPLTGTCAIYLDIRYKGKVYSDGDNILTSICDILQDANIIENDNMIRKYNVELFLATGEETHVEVGIHNYE